jgi:single-stranded-DNA-specific exonuclease
LIKRWVIAEADPAAQDLAGGLSIAAPVARVLAARGYASLAAAQAFLEPVRSQFHPPEALRGMADAADLLASTIRSGGPILLYGDYDVDGTMAVVILLAAIRACGGEAAYHVPHRLKEGYGMRPEVVDRAAAEGVKLILSVDTGIRAGAVVEHAHSLGIQVIVTDHHLPEEALPPAEAVVNPNRPDCSYPNKNLCGAAVAWKLAEALLARQGWPAERTARFSDSFLKLAAVATVADVVTLTGENRAIVKLGLEGFREIRNPGLRALLHVAGFEDGQVPTSRQVGFQIGPRINAAGRMESARMVIELFTTTDPARAEAIAAELDRLNHERRETEKRILEQILEAKQEPPAGLVLAGEGWHRGVVGIVASRVVERFHRPTFILEIDREKGEAIGSGRSIERYHLLDSLDSMGDLFVKYGGHSHAAGLTIRLDRLPEFEARFAEHAALNLSEEDLVPSLKVDAEIEPAEVKEATARDSFRLAPFGNGNPAPLFVARQLRVRSVTPLGGSGLHFKVLLERGGECFSTKAWRFDERAGEIMPGCVVDAAIQLEEDSYSGWAATLRDVRPAS